MIKSSELHEKAMNTAELAFIARKNGKVEEFKQFIEAAFLLEKEASMLLIDQKTLEPSRSVLFRSAASLALQCGRLHEAEALIDEAFDGNPPREIAKELVELIKEIQKQVFPNASRSFSLTYSAKRRVEAG